MATKRLPRDLLAKAMRDRDWFVELSGLARPLWKDALRISRSLEEIGCTRADDAVIQREVRARLQARLLRLLGYRKPGRPETAGARTLDLMTEKGLTVEQIAERDGVTPEAVMKRLSRIRT